MPPVNRRLTAMLRQALYTLKRDYGAQVDIYKLVSTSTDARTGDKAINKTLYSIPRGIVLPVKVDRTVQKNISLISSNKEFVSGGTYDLGTRIFIVDRRDCPDLPELNADDWLVYNRDKYQIKTVQAFEIDAGWVITASQLVGEVPEQFLPAKADHLLNFQQVATATVG